VDLVTPEEEDSHGQVLHDLGGPEAVSAAKRAVVNAVLGTRIMLDSLDRYLFELAAQGGLVNRRNRRAYTASSGGAAESVGGRGTHITTSRYPGARSSRASRASQ
jgi:hypothetical protein